jgi:hypothetical protein
VLANASDIYALHKKRQHKFLALHNNGDIYYLTLWQ